MPWARAAGEAEEAAGEEATVEARGASRPQGMLCEMLHPRLIAAFRPDEFRVLTTLRNRAGVGGGGGMQV